MARPVLFYSQWWPLGEYHNPEAELKAVALGEAGYEVTYVPGIGIRNPRPRSFRKATDVVTKKLEAARGRPQRHEFVASASIFAAPPRQLIGLRALNALWVRRQFATAIGDLREALVWVRYPTPEVVQVLARARPHAIVYECVDAHEHSPGIVGRWRRRFDAAERQLVELCDVAVAPSAPLADRLAKAGAEVRLIPHGVDVARFPAPRAPDGDERKRWHSSNGPTAGFVGTIDPRIDVAALELLARRHPSWKIRLLGPVQDGFDPGPLRRHANVEIGPPVPNERLGEVLAGFDLGLMPYRERPHFHYMCPVKNLEYMAVGIPAVARPNPALRRHSELLYFATTPEEFSDQAERALVEDSPELAARRRAQAEANSWRRRLDEVVHLARELAPL